MSADNVTSLARRITALVREPRLALDAAQCAQSAGLDAEQTTILEEFMRVKLRGLGTLAALLASPEDEEDLVRSLAAVWLELRFEWYRHNAVTTHQAFSTGEADALEMAKGSICSGLLAEVEEMLSAEARELLSQQAVELLDRIRPEIVQRAESQS